MKKIPLIYHPTTVVMIDDDKEFLDTITGHLPSEKALFNCFNDPEEALQYINERSADNVLSGITATDSIKVGAQDVHIDINKVYEIVYNPHRFNNISVAIVDYAMPGMNGIEFCQKIKNKNIKKILLTGVANETLAIEAFNQGIIDYFIKKNDSNLISHLNQTILDMAMNYFCDISEPFTSSAYFNFLERTVFEAEEYVQLFHDTLTNFNATEFYILDSFGSYIFINNKGDSCAIFVQNMDKIKSTQDEVNAENFDPKFKKEVNEIKQVLCYHQFNHCAFPPIAEFEKYFFQSKKMNAAETYYYAKTERLPYINRSLIKNFSKAKLEFYS